MSKSELVVCQIFSTFGKLEAKQLSRNSTE